MPEIIVKYKNKRTLEALQDFAKYFDYIISSPVSKKKERKSVNMNGVTIIPADNSIKISGISDVFTGKNLDAKQIRVEAWQRKK